MLVEGRKAKGNVNEVEVKERKGQADRTRCQEQRWLQEGHRSRKNSHEEIDRSGSPW
jgi:hypothetical protein